VLNLKDRGSKIVTLAQNIRSGLVFLRFPDDREKAFRRYYYKRSIQQVRVATVLGIILYGAIGIIDPFIVPDVLVEILILRYLIILPVLAACLVATYIFKTEKSLQVIDVIGILTASLGVAVMMFIDRGPGGQIYYEGLILMIVFGYSFPRQRFFYATLVGWATTIFYILTAIFIRKPGVIILINNSFFCMIANFIGMPIAYILEASMRTEYLNALEMKRANKALRKMSLFDDLTKIPNRRFFDIRLDIEFSELKKTGQPLSLVIIDVDYFKNYNDYFGHQMGDACLTAIAEKLQQISTRTGDLAARYGGEEFVVILSNASLPEARQVAEKARQEVRELLIPHPKSLIDTVVTISLGVATVVPSRFNLATDLVRSADVALYKAKMGGRNKVEVFTAAPV